MPRVRPFLTQEGLTWDDRMGAVITPIGLPLTLQTFPSSPVDTEVLDARLTRLSDGALNPLCAYGSVQYWEGRDFWRQRALDVLRYYGAVIALPHEPLTPGATYEAYLKVRLGSEVREFTWRFRVAAQGASGWSPPSSSRRGARGLEKGEGPGPSPLALFLTSPPLPGPYTGRPRGERGGAPSPRGGTRAVRAGARAVAP
ncbi:hypothetical protein [Thermus sp.]|jgi:hypothetical protein|uniref:hypothetical protein n=1 Tax=Thermus sp. TaxID=275 RepID=UPI003D0C8CC8